MGKYFGTDGVRGIANGYLTADLALKLGQAFGYILFTQNKRTEKPTVVIGKDTRISGDMLENALVAGFLSTGVDVVLLGVTSTPAVAYLTRTLNAAAGAMISASHNPFIDNGIKFFGADGFKVADNIEATIEQYIDGTLDMPVRPFPEQLGVTLDNQQGSQKYLKYLTQTVDTNFDGLHVALDCANGSTSNLAAKLFSMLDAKVSVMGNQPNGININDKVGSTHPEHLAEFVLETQADIGLAFDGDGDRLIVVDEKGNVRDGDYILYICGKYLNNEGRLINHTIVSTVMANLGYYRTLEAQGLSSVQTDVGDRHVAQAMIQGGYNLGGEQSGHIIFLEHSTTGDGLLTAIQLVQILKKTGVPISELADEMQKFPQLLKNLHVEDKEKVMNNRTLNLAINEVEKVMKGNGRVLVRPSGTEPLIRIMVEAENDALCEKYVEYLSEAIKTIR